MSISELLTDAMKGVVVITSICLLVVGGLGFALGKSQIKNCTENNQCLIPEPEEGFEIKIDKKRDGEVYVWGDEN